MKIAVFGLGYVGSVTAACLARLNHTVIAVDVNPEKVSRILAGESPVFEPGLNELVRLAVESDHLTATDRPAEAIASTELIMICVGTPSQANGGLDMSFVRRVTEEIGPLLTTAADRPVVCVRSTMLPGSHADLVATLETASELRAGQDFGFSVNPEFLREGSAVRDFNQPPLTLVGELDPASGDRVAQVYAEIPAPVYRVGLGVAEMVKYAGNAFHALKVTFANEIGAVSQALGIDGRQVMDVFVQDKRLNLSSRYLRPGFAYGGSCLGKDLRALLHAARQADVELPVLSAIPTSNQQQINKAVEMILSSGKREVAVIGLSFKAGTDDLRESPLVDLVEQLVGKGMQVRIFDREVNLARLLGTNKAFIEERLPHLATLLRPSLAEALEGADVIVIGKPLTSDNVDPLSDAAGPDVMVVDLVGLSEEGRAEVRGTYRGIAW